MRVLICAPTSREYRAMRYALDRAQNLRNEYDLVEVGIGKALSAAGVSRALTLAEGRYDMLAVVGFAAAALGRQQGDIVIDIDFGEAAFAVAFPEGVICAGESGADGDLLYSDGLGDFQNTFQKYL